MGYGRQAWGMESLKEFLGSESLILRTHVIVYNEILRLVPRLFPGSILSNYINSSPESLQVLERQC